VAPGTIKGMRVFLQNLPRWAWFLPGPVFGLLAFGVFLFEHPGDWQGALFPGVTILILFTFLWGFLGPVAFGRRNPDPHADAGDREDVGPA